MSVNSRSSSRDYSTPTTSYPTSSSSSNSRMKGSYYTLTADVAWSVCVSTVAWSVCMSVNSRSSSRDYSTPTTSYPTSSSSNSRMKGSYYTLTPFDSRRATSTSASAAKSSDYNLTPFTSRMSGDSSSSALREAADAAEGSGHTEAAEDRRPRRSTHSESSDRYDITLH